MSTAPGIRGVGQKSARTEARDLHKAMGWKPDRIARVLGADVDEVREWIYGKRRPAAKRQPISEASPEQRAKVKGKACIVCRRPGPCDPMHLIDRSLASDDGDPRRVVPGCRECHRRFDEEDLDLLPYLEPHFREEVAFAVEQVGLITALLRLSGDSWAPVVEA